MGAAGWYSVSQLGWSVLLRVGWSVLLWVQLGGILSASSGGVSYCGCSWWLICGLLIIALVDFFLQVSNWGCGEESVLDAVSLAEQYACSKKLSDPNDWHLFLRKDLFGPTDNLSGDKVAIDLIYHQIVGGIHAEEYICEVRHEILDRPLGARVLIFSLQLRFQVLNNLASFLPLLKDVRAHCYCASLVRTLFIRHARATSFSRACTKSKTQQNTELMPLH